MGGCFSVPTPNIDAATVAKVVAKRAVQIVKEAKEKFEFFKEQMKKHAPEHYAVEKDLTGGKEVHLTEGKDDDKKVRLVALTAATGDKLKDELRADVWTEVEPEVGTQLGDSNEMVRKAGFAGARKASDKLTDAALDQLVKKLIQQIEEGKEPSTEEGETAPGETPAEVHADEKKENAEHETEKKENAENAL